MMRLGIISEMGAGEYMGYARVYFDDLDIVSGWLALPSTGTKGTKQWVPMAVNTQVACLMDDQCEQGCIEMALWSAQDTPPEWAAPYTRGIQFPDGTEVYYDAKEHRLYINASGAELNIKCGKLNIEGEVNIKGNTNVKGEIIASDEVTAGTEKIKLTTHTHPTGVGPSGKPIPSVI